VLLPNGFTLGNLFFGVFAIVSAYRGDYMWAGWCVVLGGVMDTMDGRIARATKTGSQFGVELDSLVDAVSFGVAPAFIMYFAVLNKEGWAWLFSFIFIACVVMRLARFNVEQGGRAKSQFHGLPSPAAGMTLATYYWFSQTPFYEERLFQLPWQQAMKGLMLTLSVLMISHVLYPAVPKLGVRTVRSIVGTLLLLAAAVAVIIHPYRFAFPILLLYVAYGLVRSFILGVMDRLPTGDPLYDEDDDEEDDSTILRPTAVAESPGTGVSGRRKRRRRRPRGDRPLPPNERRTIDPTD
jgi:CDP-diacylglycerol---serine O-phosphatidyltransferase